MPYERDLNLRLEELLKLLHHTPSLLIVQILSLTLSLSRDALAFNGEIPLLKVLTELYSKVIHQIPVQLLKVTHQAGLTRARRMVQGGGGWCREAEDGAGRRRMVQGGVSVSKLA